VWWRHSQRRRMMMGGATAAGSRWAAVLHRLVKMINVLIPAIIIVGAIEYYFRQKGGIPGQILILNVFHRWCL
jgi:hypothetical protein